MQILTHLITEARALAGDNPCYIEHDWRQEWQRPCPTGNQECGQPVYRCARCGVYDYGDSADSEGATECRSVCGDSMTGWHGDDLVS